MSHVWPSISPHGPEVPGSVWNLPHRMFVIFAAGADEWVKAQRESSNPPAGPGSIRYRVGG